MNLTLITGNGLDLISYVVGLLILRKDRLTDTGKNVQKWTRVFPTRRWVILVARTRRKKRVENSVSTFGRFRLWTSFESSPVSVNNLQIQNYDPWKSLLAIWMHLCRLFYIWLYLKNHDLYFMMNLRLSRNSGPEDLIIFII